MQVNVQSSSDKKFPVSCEPGDSVTLLKISVAKEIGCEKENVRLIYAGRILKDDDTLESYGIKDGHVIHVVKTGITKPAPAASTTTPAATTLATTATSNVVSSPPQTNTSTSPRMNPFGSMMGMDPAMLAGMTPSADEMAQANQMMQNPEFLDSAIQMMTQNPELMQSIMAMDPRFQSMPPEMRQMMTNPEFLRMALMMNASMAQGGQGSAGGMPFGMPFGMPTSPSQASNEPPEVRFQSQLSQLNDMGFFDADENIRALLATGGNVNAAIERLLNGNL